MSKNSRHKKAPVAPTTRALESNAVNDQVNNVMSKNNTAMSNVIPFRSAKLLLVDFDGQPFVPMKPVVDGMGLDWKSQYEKLNGGRFKAVMVIIPTTGSDGKTYEMSCLPLRKLPGWLMSIHASKVREDLRDNVIAYQNECDDALWSYWNDGHATNHRDPSESMTLIGKTIGTDGFHMLGSVVKGKVAGLPRALQRRATSKIWSQTHAAFGVRSAEDIPADQLDSARNFIAAYVVLEGEFIPRKPKEQRLTIHYPIEVLAKRRQGMLVESAGERIWLDVALRDLCDIKGEGTPCEELLWELERAGYDIRGAWWELRTYRNKLQSLESWVRGMNCVMDEPQRYAVDMGASA